MLVTKDLVMDFEQFALEKLAQGAHLESLDDLVDAYYLAARPPELAHADAAAIRASLADFERGERGRVVEEFDADFQSRNGLSAR